MGGEMGSVDEVTYFGDDRMCVLTGEDDLKSSLVQGQDEEFRKMWSSLVNLSSLRVGSCQLQICVVCGENVGWECCCCFDGW